LALGRPSPLNGKFRISECLTGHPMAAEQDVVASFFQAAVAVFILESNTGPMFHRRRNWQIIGKKKSGV
jgi:hypothetical protein